MNLNTVESFIREIERYQSELSSSIQNSKDDDKITKLKQLNKLTQILINLSDYKTNYIDAKPKSKK
jgi:hypothetical protein